MRGPSHKCAGRATCVCASVDTLIGRPHGQHAAADGEQSVGDTYRAAVSTYELFVYTSPALWRVRRLFGCADTPAVWITSAPDSPHARSDALYASPNVGNGFPDAATAAPDAGDELPERPTKMPAAPNARADQPSGRTAEPTDKTVTVNASPEAVCG